MSLTAKLEKRAYPAVLAFVVLMAASIQVKIVLGIELKSWILLLCCMCVTAIIFAVDYFGKTREVCIAVGILAIFAAVVLWFNRENIEDIWEYIKGEKLIWLVGFVILAGVALYISQQFFALRIAVCVGYWGAMIALLFVDLFPVKYVMYWLVAELVLVLIEVLNKKADLKKIFFMTPVMLVVVILLSVLPYDEKPFNWRAVYDWVCDLIDGKDLPQFDISNEKVGFIGYSETVDLHGNKVDVSRETLKISMLGNKENIYLAGTIKNEYTGDGWIGNPKNTGYEGNFKEYQLDAAELLYAMYRAGVIADYMRGEREENVWYLRHRELTVTYDGMRGASVFRPSKMIKLSLIKNEGELEDEADNIRFTERQKAYTSYSLEFFTINRKWKNAKELIREQSEYVYDTMTAADYKEFRRIVHLDYSSVELPESEDFEKELKERAEFIRSNYLEVPENIVERMTWLAGEIVEGYETESDYDKMERIVRYLSYYTYTKTPGIVPEGKDVVEYFLFESGKGYCTHFASAAALLGRCIGIPTRLVQGYLLDAELSSERGEYIVNETQAHAWLECYFEGVGWIIFDPTPGNEEMLYQDWELPSYIDKTTGNYKPVNPDGTIMETTSEEETSEEETSEEETSENETKKPTENPPGNKPNDADDNAKKQERRRAIIVSLIVIGIVLLIKAIISIIKARQNAFWKKYEDASYGDRLRIDMILVLWILKKEGHPINNHETLSEYIRRVSGEYSEKAVLLSEVCDLYQKARYGDKNTITKEDHRKSQRLRLLFMTEKISEGAMVRYGRKFLK